VITNDLLNEFKTCIINYAELEGNVQLDVRAALREKTRERFMVQNSNVPAVSEKEQPALPVPTNGPGFFNRAAQNAAAGLVQSTLPFSQNDNRFGLAAAPAQSQ